MSGGSSDDTLTSQATYDYWSDNTDTFKVHARHKSTGIPTTISKTDVDAVEAWDLGGGERRKSSTSHLPSQSIPSSMSGTSTKRRSSVDLLVGDSSCTPEPSPLERGKSITPILDGREEPEPIFEEEPEDELGGLNAVPHELAARDRGQSDTLAEVERLMTSGHSAVTAPYDPQEPVDDDTVDYQYHHHTKTRPTSLASRDRAMTAHTKDQNRTSTASMMDETPSQRLKAAGSQSLPSTRPLSSQMNTSSLVEGSSYMSGGSSELEAAAAVIKEEESSDEEGRPPAVSDASDVSTSTEEKRRRFLPSFPPDAKDSAHCGELEDKSEELMQKLRQGNVVIRVVTWNQNGKKAPHNIEHMLAKNQCHIMVFGSQECENPTAGFFKKGKPRWESILTKAMGSNYQMITSHTMVAMHIAIFARKEMMRMIWSVSTADVATGIGNALGNKGAVGVTINIGRTSFAFINSHFAPYQHQTEERNANFHRVNQMLGLYPFSAKQNTALRREPLLNRFDQVFWFGDLNYRVNGNREVVEEMLRKDMYEVLMSNDQLLEQRCQGNAFVGLTEGPIKFLPTYKYDNGTDTYDSSPKRRIPSWTDRVLFKDHPDLILLRYNRCDEPRTSDHRAVYADFECKFEHVASAAPSANSSLVARASARFDQQTTSNLQSQLNALDEIGEGDEECDSASPPVTSGIANALSNALGRQTGAPAAKVSQDVEKFPKESNRRAHKPGESGSAASSGSAISRALEISSGGGASAGSGGSSGSRGGLLSAALKKAAEADVAPLGMVTKPSSPRRRPPTKKHLRDRAKGSNGSSASGTPQLASPIGDRERGESAGSNASSKI